MSENNIEIEKQNNIVSGDEISKLHKAALDYAKDGIPVFPVVPNNKRPLSENGFKDATTDPSVINGWWSQYPDANIGIPTGEITSWLVVDVDNKNGVSGNDSFNALIEKYGELPETRQHLTPSGGYHLIFRYSGTEIRSSVGKLGPGLDIRCNGGYVVAPPSVIDGSRYQFDNMCIPIKNAPEWLIKLAVASKDKVADKGVSEGHRNDCIFEQALECRKQGLSFEEAQVEVEKINQEKCNPPLENEEVQKTLASAYRYEVTEIPAQIEELNRKHAVVMVGGKCRVLKETICPLFNWADIELSNPSDFREFYSNRYIQVDQKKKPLGDAWLRSPYRRQYEGLVFAPGGARSGYYNLWRGFATEPAKGDCSLYLKHIEENIANGDEAVYKYIIGWMAHTIQHPDILLGTAIVLRGNMGTGKGVFANQFGKLFGRHYFPLAQSSQLTGKFNFHMKDIVMLFADEAFWAGDKTAEGVLKSLITEPFLVIEGKGENAIKVKNHLHMIFATNNDWAVPAGAQERRFFVIDVGNKHMQDKPYFKAIGEQMDSGGREALLYYLMNYDLTGINLSEFPKTAALMESKLHSLSPVQKFWYQILETGDLEYPGSGWGDGKIATEKLYESYIKFCNDIGIRHRDTAQLVGTTLKKMVSLTKNRKSRIGCREYEYTFPSLRECRESFDKFVNFNNEWLDDK